MPGGYDPVTGTWEYAEDDTISPWSGYMNKLATSVKNALGFLGPWQTYTPTLTTTGTAPVLGTGSSTAGRFRQIGKTVIGRGSITWGTSGSTFGTASYLVSLPVPLQDNGTSNVVGFAWLYDSSALTNYMATLMPNSSTTVAFRPHGIAGSASPTTPFTWAASDAYRFAFTYEAA